MPDNVKPIIIDPEKAYAILKDIWSSAACSDHKMLDRIENLMTAAQAKSFRYALITQLLAKVVEPKIDVLSIQAGDTESTGASFDARSFCKKVVVKAEKELWGGVLGGSPDPYVNKPLRRKRLQPPDEADVKNRKAYEILYDLLIEAGSSEKRSREILECTLTWIKKRLNQVVSPPELKNVSLEALQKIVAEFIQELGTSMLGAIPQYMVYALFRAVDEVAGVYGRIETGKATEADAASGKLSDVVVYDNRNEPKIVVSVTDKIDKQKLQNEIAKAERAKVKELMIIARTVDPDLKISGESPVYYKIYKLDEFITTTVWMINADVRERFIRKLYEVFRENNLHEALVKLDAIVRRHIS